MTSWVRRYNGGAMAKIAATSPNQYLCVFLHRRDQYQGTFSTLQEAWKWADRMNAQRGTPTRVTMQGAAR